MLTLYLVCLVLGGLLLGLSLLTGGDADLDVDVDVAPDLDAGEPDLEAGGEGWVAAARFLSVRNLVFFVAFFGLTGSLLTLLAASPAVTLPASLGLGTAAAVAVGRLMGYLRRTESGEPTSLRSLEGARAQVVVEVGRERPGKIAVAAGDRTHQLLARIHESAAAGRLGAGETVVVVSVENGVARVAEESFLA